MTNKTKFVPDGVFVPFFLTSGTLRLTDGGGNEIS